MRIPPNAAADVKEAFRELHERIDKVLGSPNAGHPNVRGRRITNAGDAVADADLVTLRQLNDAVLGTSPTPAPVAAGDATTPGGGGVSGGTDDGLGAQGCAQAGADGHVTGPLTEVLVGQIICGTGNEFASLKAATADAATRDANAEQLTRRMIWHLALAGFTAGRQKNPSGVISTGKLTVQVEGVFRAYDVFASQGDYTQPMQTHADQVFPASYVADSGIAD